MGKAVLMSTHNICFGAKIPNIFSSPEPKAHKVSL